MLRDVAGFVCSGATDLAACNYTARAAPCMFILSIGVRCLVH